MSDFWKTRRGQILRWVRYLHEVNGGAVETRELAEATHMTTNVVASVTAYLVKAGLIKRIDHGHFLPMTLMETIIYATENNKWHGVRAVAPEIAQSWKKDHDTITDLQQKLIHMMNRSKHGQESVIKAKSVVQHFKGAA